MRSESFRKKTKFLLLFLCLVLIMTARAYPVFGTDAEDVSGLTPVRIALIDTGVSTFHLDPSAVLPGKNYAFGNNGGSNSGPYSGTSDSIGHGTAAAGLILGSEEFGISGVYPDAEIVPLTVVDKYPSGVTANGGNTALCSAIYDAVDVFGCRVINISLSASEDCLELRDAVEYALSKDVVIVAAAGNEGSSPGGVYYPASYDGVISAGSSEAFGVSDFSVPGADVLCRGTSLETVSHLERKGRVRVSGTSYSCALISGLCARIIAEGGCRTGQDAVERIISLACDVGTVGFDSTSGWGIIPDQVLWPLYDDVSVYDPAYGAICRMAELGLMNGTGHRRFSPDTICTRGQIVFVLWTYAGEPAADIGYVFSDVSAGRYYSQAISWAAENSLVGGFPDGTFRPDDPISRQQLAVIFENCEHLFSGDRCLAAVPPSNLFTLNSTRILENRRYTDASDINALAPYASGAFLRYLKEGIFDAPDGLLLPQAYLTRSMFALITARYIGS